MKGLISEKKIFLVKKFRHFLFVFFLFTVFAIPHSVSAYIFDIFQLATDPLFAALGLLLLEIGAFIVGIAGNVLDGTINHSLVLMSHYVSSITGITIAWGVIRDLINMSFIFILLYIAIGTILGLSGVNWKKTLVQIVVAAVLINFSLFFTKVIIDVSNLLALTFYNQLTGSTGTISGEFVNSLNLTTLYFDPNNSALTGPKVFLIGIMGSIFLIITAIAFLIASFLFLSRFVTFIFLLILSPIGFFGSILPGLGQYAKQWRDTLFAQALFAPIYMILTWVSLRIISDPQFLPNSKATLSNKVSYIDVISKTQVTNAAVNIAPGAFDIFINFIVIIMFMLATIIISKKTASQGSTYGQQLVKGAFGLGAASGAWAGRRTLGWAANTADKKGYLRGMDRAAAGSGFVRGIREGGLRSGLTTGIKTYGARATRATVRGTATGNLDIRKGINTVGGLVGFKNASGEMGFGDQLSSAGAGGYAGLQKDKKKAQDERNQLAQLATSADQVEAGVAAQQNPAFESAKAAVLAGTATQAQRDLVGIFDTMEKTMARMTDKEVESLVESNKKLLGEQTFTTMLSTRQLDALNKSDKFTEQEKNNLKRSRFASAESIANPVAANIGAASQIQNLNDKELEMVDPTMLENADFVSQLKQSQIEAIAKSDRFTTTQKGSVKRLRKNAVETKLRTTPALVKKTHAKELSEYGAANPGDLLIDPAIMRQYDPKVLKRLGSELNDEKSAQLRSAILSSTDPALAPIQGWLNTPAGVSAL